MENAGLDRQQAVAIATAVRDAHDSTDAATKGDIALVRKDIEFLRWMMGAVLGGIVALILKSFF